jgi:RecA/RadA recombinase
MSTTQQTLTINEMKTALKQGKPRTGIPSRKLLSTGSTLLNLACSGRGIGGLYKSCYALIVGDSDSGKTMLSMTILAEAHRNKRFDEYRFIHDNPEGGAMMDISTFFGQGVADRLEEPPRGTSQWAEDFYYNMDDLFKARVPFIYILDSMDVLDCRDDAKKFESKKKARDTNKEESGSYGMAKAKLNSENLRRVRGRLEKSGSILIILSQSRDSVGFGAKFNPKTRAGGRALKFYTRLELWTSVKGQIKKTIRGKPREMGIISRVQIKKNHVTGKKRTVDIPIYHSFGIDDLGSCVDYLIEEKHWKGTKEKVVAPEFEFKGPKEQLIRLIEKNDREKELQDLVAEVWDAIESATAVKRKQRYV